MLLSSRRCVIRRVCQQFSQEWRGFASVDRPHHFEITEDDRKRIYILSSSREALWYAANLRLNPNPPPVTMLVLNTQRITMFLEQGSKITLEQPDGTKVEAYGCEMETIFIQEPNLRLNAKPIGNLSFRYGGYLAGQNSNSVAASDGESSIAPKPIANICDQYGSRPAQKFRHKNAKNPSTAPGEPISKDRWLSGKCVSEQRSIINLIVPTTTSFQPDLLRAIRGRLSNETCVFFDGYQVGMIHHWCETAFRDLRTRPTFFRGISSHSISKNRPLTSPVEDVEQRVRGLQDRSLKNPMGREFAIRYSGRGELSLGLPCATGLSQYISTNEKIPSYEYMVKVLSAPDNFKTFMTTQERLVLFCFMRTAVIDIVGGMAASLECPNMEYKVRLESDPAAAKLAELLLQETSELYGRLLPVITRNDVQRWLDVCIERMGKGGLNRQILSVRDGIDTAFDFNTAWVIKQCHREGIECPAHEVLLKTLMAKIEKYKKLNAEAALAAENSRHYSPRRPKLTIPSSDKNFERRDPLEVKREKKADRQRELLGNQPLPDRFVNPSIAPLGSAPIRRVASRVAGTLR